MTTIELGELTEPGERPDNGPPVRFDRRALRRAAVLGTVLLCLFAVTASARPAPPKGLRPLWRVAMSNSDTAILGTDTVYAQRSTLGRSQLTSYDLTTGAVRWEHLFDEGVGYGQLAEKAGLVLLPADRQAVTPGPDTTLGEFSRTTIALDAHTGEPRWRAPGQAQIIAGDTVLLADFADNGDYTRLTLARLADRQTIWTRAVPGAYSMTSSTSAGEPDRLITATKEGEIEVLRYADGVRVTGGSVAWVRPNQELGRFNDLSADRGFLAINRNQQNHAEVTIYRLDTLAELWRADNTYGYAFACGAALCLNGEHGLGAYDPATGRESWHLGDSANGWAAGDDRMIAEDAENGGDNATLGLLDAGTGRAIGESVRGQAVWTATQGSYALVMHNTTSPPDHASVTRWDLATGRATLLGSVELTGGYRCQSVPGYLACQSEHDYQVMAAG